MGLFLSVKVGDMCVGWEEEEEEEEEGRRRREGALWGLRRRKTRKRKRYRSLPGKPKDLKKSVSQLRRYLHVLSFSILYVNYLFVCLFLFVISSAKGDWVRRQAALSAQHEVEQNRLANSAADGRRWVEWQYLLSRHCTAWHTLL